MRPSGVFHLYRVRLHARLPQELLAVLGIAVGVALVYIALVANASLTGSVRELMYGIVGDARLQVAARGPEGLSERLVHVVKDIDGVATAVPFLEQPAHLVGPRGERSVTLISGDAREGLGGGPLVRRFSSLTLATQANDARIVALPAPLAAALGVSVGDPVRIEVGRGSAEVPLGMRLERGEYGNLVDSPIALAPAAFAKPLSGMEGRVTRIFVGTEPGRKADVHAALQAVAGRANVSRVDHDMRAFARAADPTIRSTAVFSLFAALIGFLFALSAVLLTVPQRRRFVTDLRTAGHEPWVAIQLLLFDAFALGLAGSIVGLLAGDIASRHVFGAVPSYLTFAFAVGDQRTVSWENVAAALGVGVGSACVAILVPLRDVLLLRGTRATGATDGFGPARAAGAAGCAMVTFATAIVVLTPRTGIVALIAMAAAVLLFLPAALRVAATAFEVLTRRLRTPMPTLAALELRSRSARARALALAATGTVAVFSTVAVGGSHADLLRGLNESARAVDSNGDVWVTFPGAANAFATTPLHASPATIRRLRRVAGVADVAVYRGSFLDVGERRAWVQAPPRSAPTPIAAHQIRRGDPARTTARLRAGGWVVLSHAIAERLDAGIGDRVALPTPAHTPLRVAAISTNLGWPSGAIVLNADDYARAWRTRAATALHIRAAPGASPARVAASVRRALPPALPALVETQQRRIARHHAAGRQSLQRLDQVSVIVLSAAVLAMAGAMAGMIWQRRPAMAALKVHGYPEGELWGALLLESALLLGTGGLLGAVFGLYDQIILTRALVAITDFPVFYATAGVAALGILLLVTVVALAMIALPGWLAVRVRPSPGRTT